MNGPSTFQQDIKSHILTMFCLCWYLQEPSPPAKKPKKDGDSFETSDDDFELDDKMPPKRPAKRAAAAAASQAKRISTGK